MNKKLGSFIRIFISFFLLSLLFYLLRDKLPDVWNAIRTADPKTLWTAFFVFFIPYFFLLVLRLKFIFVIQKVKLSIKYLYFLRFIGYFFNNFLPSAVGGDLASAYLATKRTRKDIECFTGIFSIF